MKELRRRERFDLSVKRPSHRQGLFCTPTLGQVAPSNWIDQSGGDLRRARFVLAIDDQKLAFSAQQIPGEGRPGESLADDEKLNSDSERCLLANDNLAPIHHGTLFVDGVDAARAALEWAVLDVEDRFANSLIDVSLPVLVALFVDVEVDAAVRLRLRTDRSPAFRRVRRAPAAESGARGRRERPRPTGGAHALA